MWNSERLRATGNYLFTIYITRHSAPINTIWIYAIVYEVLYADSEI